MAFEFKGKLIEKNETIVISDKFQKREFILEQTEQNENGTFINPVKFQLIQNRCDLINNYNLGDELTVQFNIKGNKWEKDGKTSYFTNLDVWKIEGQSNSTPADGFDKLPEEPEGGSGLPF